MTLTLVPQSPAMCCMPWHGRGFEGEPVHGAVCCFCDRDVARPDRLCGKRVACIYCGLDRGLIPEEEREPFAQEPENGG